MKSYTIVDSDGKVSIATEGVGGAVGGLSLGFALIVTLVFYATIGGIAYLVFRLGFKIFDICSRIIGLKTSLSASYGKLCREHFWLGMFLTFILIIFTVICVAWIERFLCAGQNIAEYYGVNFDPWIHDVCVPSNWN